METQMTSKNDVSGAAALAISRSLISSVVDRAILPEKDEIGVLRHATGAQHNAPANDRMSKMHDAVAVLIQSIIDCGNSVRRPD